jgi:Heterokaryon incompatibility protein (HET)
MRFACKPRSGIRKSDQPPVDSTQPFMLGVFAKQSYDGPGYIQIGALGYKNKIIELSYDEPSLKLQGSLRFNRTDADEVFSLADRWLTDCCDNHESCDQVQDEQLKRDLLPTRLLEIKSSNNKLVSIRLRDTDEESFDRSVPYLALSHCWGGTIATTLKNSTVASFEKEIEISSLPKTFIDAAVVAIRLRYRYLWIDSLCN